MIADVDFRGFCSENSLIWLRFSKIWKISKFQKFQNFQKSEKISDFWKFWDFQKNRKIGKSKNFKTGPQFCQFLKLWNVCDLNYQCFMAEIWRRADRVTYRIQNKKISSKVPGQLVFALENITFALENNNFRYIFHSYFLLDVFEFIWTNNSFVSAGLRMKIYETLCRFP